MLAGQATQVDRLHDVLSIEWAGSEAIIYTQRNAQGRPSKVHAMLLPYQIVLAQFYLDMAVKDCYYHLPFTACRHWNSYVWSHVAFRMPMPHVHDSPAQLVHSQHHDTRVQWQSVVLL